MTEQKKHRVHKAFRRTYDPIWYLQLGILVVAGLRYFTDDSFLPYNKFIVIGFELILMVVLGALTSEGYARVSKLRPSDGGLGSGEGYWIL